MSGYPRNICGGTRLELAGSGFGFGFRRCVPEGAAFVQRGAKKNACAFNAHNPDRWDRD
jgi:hypothetical protein